MSGTSDTDTRTNGAPRVFVSYTHESPDHKRWVSDLARELRDKGVNIVLDQWDLGLGGDVTLFMEKGIRDAERVLLVCTPAYCRKANEGMGGVGYERLVVTSEIASKIDTNKFICVLRAGTKEDSIPAFAKTRIYVDFTGTADFELAFDALLRDIHQVPANPKPPLGPNPFKSGLAQIPGCDEPIAESTETAPIADIETVYAQSVRLLRMDDMLGWKHLVRQLRRNVPVHLAQWRDNVEKIAGRRNDDEWREDLYRAISTASPLICAALVAVESDRETVANQTGILDDFLQLSNWNRAGYRRVVETPLLIAHFFHHVMGAIFINEREHHRAISLLSSTVQAETRLEPGPLWASHELMFASEALTTSVTEMWRFLLGLYPKLTWLSHFFVNEREYVEGVRAYRTVASLIELGKQLVSGQDVRERPQRCTCFSR